METDRSDTTRTDLRGCLERTLADNSCTQIDMDIRCAMFVSKTAKSMMPVRRGDVCAVSDSCLEPHDFKSCRRSALNDEGIAPRTTESARTMPISSSSDRWASLAASNSSVAIPNETENARSEPSDPRVPAVLMPATALLTSFQLVATSEEVNALSKEGVVVPHLLAWQEGPCLSIRKLLLGDIVATRSHGKCGKASRRVRVGRTHHHHYSSCVFGCLLRNLVYYAKQESNLRTSEASVHLCMCLQPAKEDILSCTGADSIHLHRGLACYSIIRGQLLLLPESKASLCTNARYGSKGAAIGIGASIYYLFSMFRRNASSTSALCMSTAYFVERCLRLLQSWENTCSDCLVCHKAALDAEKRALCRGLLAIKTAKGIILEKGIDDYRGLQIELAFMRKGMWPHGKEISGATQASLCEWIETSTFAEASMPNIAERPRPIDGMTNKRFSSLRELASHEGRNAMDDDDFSSVDGSGSITSSYPSTESSVGDPEYNNDQGILTLAL